MGAIYLIRHGQASFGADEYDELSETGVRQAELLGAALKRRLGQVDRVVSGAMTRHLHTAEACVSSMGLGVELERAVDPGWNEFDHVQLICACEPRYSDKARMREELLNAEDPRQAFVDLWTRATGRWLSGQHDADYPESWPGFLSRVEGALQRLVGSLGRSKTALVFTSGGAISAVCRSLLELSDARTLALNATLANTGLTKLLYSRRGVALSTLNDYGHLEAEPSLLTWR